MGPPRATRWWTPLLGGLVASLTILGPSASGHVDYVAPEGAAGGSIGDLLGPVLSNPGELAVLGVGALALVGSAIAWWRWGHHVPDVRVLRRALRGYDRFVPWMLRLSLGLPLVGAGFAGYLFTPVVPVGPRLPQVTLGFLLLLGLATRAAALVGLAGWVAATIGFGPELLLAGEYVGGFIALGLVGPGRPSADHMLAQLASTEGTWYHRLDPVYEIAARFQSWIAPARAWAPVAVRGALGGTFLYLGIVEKLMNPGPAIELAVDLGLPGLLPLSAEMWVLSTALVEVCVGSLLVLGVFTRAASAAAFLVLTTTLFALPTDPVLPHVALFGLSSVVFTWGPGPARLDVVFQPSRTPSEPPKNAGDDPTRDRQGS